jgi:cyanophycin synthetase
MRGMEPVATSLLDALARGGRPGRELAVRADLLRSVGVREAWRRGRDTARRQRLPRGREQPGYRRLWQAAAEQVGAEFVDLSDGFFEFRRGGVSARVWNHWVPFDDIVTLQVALDKALSHRLVSAAGLPIPEHAVFDAGDLAPALAFLRSTAAACVVKPLQGAGGSATTAGVRTPEQLRRARLRAARRYRRLMIERQVAGDVYRVLLLDGRLLGAVRRRPPTVTGDGHSTISELIAAENERRFLASAGARTWLLRADLDAVFALENAGLSLSAVPAEGKRVAVKTTVGQNAAADNETVDDIVSVALVADAVRAARAVGVRLAGVDLITPDASLPLDAAGGVILEVNATPGLQYHYEVRDPVRATPVMAPILEALLDTAA